MNEIKIPKLLILFSMIYLAILLSGVSVLHKTIILFSHPVTATALISPLWFVMTDILAEIYGFRIGRNIFYCAITCQWIYVIVCNLLIRLHSPADWHYQLYYNFVFDGLFRLNLSMLIAIILVGNINIYLITRWKFLLKGKYFWLRSIGSSGISEILYSVFTSIFVFFGKIGFSDLISFIMLSLLLKIIYTIILAYPANILTTTVKKIEKIDIYDNININPLKSFY